MGRCRMGRQQRSGGSRREWYDSLLLRLLHAYVTTRHQRTEHLLYVLNLCTISEYWRWLGIYVVGL
jgi:hypothetical protein